jgi:hypothetical protein
MQAAVATQLLLSLLLHTGQIPFLTVALGMFAIGAPALTC